MRRLFQTFFLLGAPLFAALAAPAPDFSLVGHDGKTYALKDLKGKVVVLEWTNHECPFVRKHYDTGNMQKLQEKYVKQGVVWLSVNSGAPGKGGHLADPKAASERYKAEGSKATALLIDAQGTAGNEKAYNARTTPHMFVIDKAGELVYDGAIDSESGADKETVAKARNFVAPVLDKLISGEKVSFASNKPYGCSVKFL